MDGKLLAQLACVAQKDCDALRNDYAWPPRPPMTNEEREESERLRVLASRLFLRAASKGWGTAGYDEIPTDIADTMTFFVAEIYQGRSWLGLKSQALSEYGSIVYQSWDMAPRVKQCVVDYKRYALV